MCLVLHAIFCSLYFRKWEDAWENKKKWEERERETEDFSLLSVCWTAVSAAATTGNNTEDTTDTERDIQDPGVVVSQEAGDIQRTPTTNTRTQEEGKDSAHDLRIISSFEGKTLPTHRVTADPSASSSSFSDCLLPAARKDTHTAHTHTKRITQQQPDTTRETATYTPIRCENLQIRKERTLVTRWEGVERLTRESLSVGKLSIRDPHIFSPFLSFTLFTHSSSEHPATVRSSCHVVSSHVLSTWRSNRRMKATFHHYIMKMTKKKRKKEKRRRSR